MKQCSKCRKSKHIEQYTPNSRSRGGYHAQCKQCKAEYARAYYKTHLNYRKKIHSNGKVWYEKNKEKMKEKYRKKRDYINKVLHQYKMHPQCPSCRCF